MLDIKFIRENRDIVKTSIKNRNMTLDIDELLKLDEEKRKLMGEAEDLKCQRNKANDEISSAIKEKRNPKEIIDRMKVISQKIGELDGKVEGLDKKVIDFLYIIPNIPDNSIPIGGPNANKVVKTWGDPKKLSFKPLDHIELAEKLGIINFGVSAKISGAGFACYMGAGARLERGLINFMLDLHTKKHGYKEIFPPYLVNRASMTATGQLPKLEEDMYRLRDDELYLIPTAEVPVTNIHRSDLLEEAQLPIRYTAYTACFRREAGSYGKQTRGLIRVHQFDKVELVKFVKPETSADEHESLLADAEEVLQLLGLHYRVLLLATGDISFAAAKCYDIELFAPGTNAYLEVSSCSNFTDFQARRANIRYRSKDAKKPAYVHTLNGSGVALARLVVAILENYQNEDGTVTIPEALRPFMDNMSTITAGGLK